MAKTFTGKEDLRNITCPRDFLRGFWEFMPISDSQSQQDRAWNGPKAAKKLLEILVVTSGV